MFSHFFDFLDHFPFFSLANQHRVSVRLLCHKKTGKVLQISLTNRLLWNRGIQRLVLVAFNSAQLAFLHQQEQFSYNQKSQLDVDKPLSWFLQIRSNDEDDYHLTLLPGQSAPYIQKITEMDGHTPQNNAFLFFIDRMDQAMALLDNMQPECNNPDNIKLIFQRVFPPDSEYTPYFYKPPLPDEAFKA